MASELATGVRSSDLAAAVRGRYTRSGRALTEAELAAWLVESGFASVESDGTLRPTALGLEIGRALAS